MANIGKLNKLTTVLILNLSFAISQCFVIYIFSNNRLNVLLMDERLITKGSKHV